MSNCSRRPALAITGSAFEMDPNDLTNRFEAADYKETVRRLASALRDDTKTFHGPLLESPGIRAALAEAVGNR